MDNSGRIMSVSDLQKLSPEERKPFMPIPQKEEQRVFSMSRKERREWYKQNRKISGLTWSEANEKLAIK